MSVLHLRQPLGWRCALCYICDLAMVADLAARHLFFPSVASCYEAYQLQGTTEFPFLQGFQQSLAVVCQLCSILLLVPLSMCCVWEVGHADQIPSREQQLHFTQGVAASFTL